MKGRTYKEIASTALGWWLFFSVNLILGLVVVTSIQVIRAGIDWRLALPVFLKWEFLMLFFAVAIAVIMHVYKYYLRFLPFRGFFRTSIVYFLAYVAVVIALPFLPYGRVLVIGLESNLAVVVLLLVIVRVVPQKYFKDPEGPIFAPPLDDLLSNEIRPFGAFQSGLDFEREMGTPVYAALDGTVKMTWPYKGDGNTVKIQHGAEFSSIYAHLSEIVVKNGQEVKTGELVGYVGNTGHSFTPQLHFEIRYRNKVVDPKEYLVPGQKMAKKQGNGGSKKKSSKKSKK